MFINPNNIINSIEITGYENVVDIGAGSGAYTLLFAHRLHHGHVYAVDVQGEVLGRLAKEVHDKKIPNITCIHADASILRGVPLQDEIASLTIMSNILNQTEHPMEMLKEAARLTHTGGLLLLIDWTNTLSGMGPLSSHRISEKDALKSAMSAGFSLEKELKTEKHHWAILLRRNFIHDEDVA